MPLSTTSTRLLNTPRDGDNHFPGQPVLMLDNPFNEEVRKQERNLQEHQSECLALRSSGRINSSMTIKTSFQLIEVLSSPTQYPSTSHIATPVPGQKQYALQVFTQLTSFCKYRAKLAKPLFCTPSLCSVFIQRLVRFLYLSPFNLRKV